MLKQTNRAADLLSVTAISIALFNFNKLEMWANAQPDGRPAEYR